MIQELKSLVIFTTGGTFNDHRINQTYPAIIEVDQIKSFRL